MITELLNVIAFTTLVILGVHAVTRPGKLLWFLGFRIHQLDEIEHEQEELSVSSDNLFLEYQANVEKIEFEYNEDCQGDIKAKYLKEAQGDYEKKVYSLRDSKEVRIDWLQKKVDFLANKPHIKAMIKVAPMITECLVCMASFWSFVILTLHFTGALYGCFLFIPISLPFCILAVAGLNSIISSLIK